MNGFINIYKPSKITSARVVGAVKRAFNRPCGHMGTLDPMASGVLPVGIGKASRLFPYLLDKEKTYIAEFTFGFTTDTLDTTGKVTDTTDILPTEKELKNALCTFIGDIEQVPPKYSAKNVLGKRGYDLARKGVEFELAPKTVRINNIELLEKTGENSYSFKIDCKGGTYIRSLARDIAFSCGSLGVMSALERTKSGIFTVENSVTVEQMQSAVDINSLLIAPDEVVSFDKMVLTKKQAKRLIDGLNDDLGYKDGTYRVYAENEFWGVGKSENGFLRLSSYVKES